MYLAHVSDVFVSVLCNERTENEYILKRQKEQVVKPNRVFKMVVVLLFWLFIYYSSSINKLTASGKKNTSVFINCGDNKIKEEEKTAEFPQKSMLLGGI